jgi:transposase
LGFKPDLWPSPLAQQAAAGRHSGEFPVIFEKKKKKKKKKRKRKKRKEKKQRNQKRPKLPTKRGHSCPFLAQSWLVGP